MKLLQRLLGAVQRSASPKPIDLARAGELMAAGLELHRQGDLASAEALYWQAVDAAPQEASAYHLLGGVLGQSGRIDEARLQLERALALRPAFPAALVDLGHVLRLQGDPQAAIAAYRKALAFEPGFALAAVSLGEVLLGQREHAAAVEAFEIALQAPADARAMKGMVAALEQLDRAEAACRACEQVLVREPAHAEAHASLGYLLLKRHFDPQRALGHLQQAIRLRPDDSEVQANIGIAFQDLGLVHEAVNAYEAALAIDPNCTIARFHRSLALLSRGEYAAAWADYELRLLSEEAPRRAFPYPHWDGGDLSGKTLLVTAEQGIGDEIMFASCIPDLTRRAGHVIVECSHKLEPIYRRSFPEATIHGGSQFDALDWLARLPPVDLTCPVGSLPLHLRKNRGQFPMHTGYLRAAPEVTQEYRRRLRELGTGLNVGLSWRGGTPKSRGALRSLRLEQLLPLLRLPGVNFVDLQYDDATREIEQVRHDHGCIVHRWPDALDDYDRTAALVASLDVVVSVCTAVVHLGGALGKPVWVMAPIVPEWRYGHAAEDMPWYPSVRIVRQLESRQWEPVIARVCAVLRSLRDARATQRSDQDEIQSRAP
jgi:tetratricopeptide (TPR) repeat protein